MNSSVIIRPLFYHIKYFIPIVWNHWNIKNINDTKFTFTQRNYIIPQIISKLCALMSTIMSIIIISCRIISMVPQIFAKRYSRNKILTITDHAQNIRSAIVLHSQRHGHPNVLLKSLIVMRIITRYSGRCTIRRDIIQCSFAYAVLFSIDVVLIWTSCWIVLTP